MFKKNLLILIFSISILIHSQNQEDALRYSLFDNYSTARVSALGGSFSALGGNSGAIYSNPAALGTYRTNEFSISLMSNNQIIETNYIDNTNTVDNHKIIFPNISYIQTIPIKNGEGWNRLNYAFTYNRKNDLNKDFQINAFNPSNSMGNTFLQGIGGTNPDELNAFSDYLAFWTYLIDTLPGGTEYFSNIQNIGQNQYKNIKETGYIDDLDISISGSYKDFLFVGGSFCMSSINFTQHNRYLEDGFQNVENSVESFNYNQDLYVDGFGMNFKIGAIIKPTHFIRLGLTHHSKTYYELEETYQTNMTTNFFDGDEFTAISPLNYFNYKLNTPAKSIGSLAIVFAKKGLITIDYESIDYGSSTLSSNNYNFFTENNNIIDFYRRTNNKKIGIEWKIKDIAFRGGYAIFGSPFNNNLNNDRKYISGGIGFQTGAYFFDIAIISCLQDEEYMLYESIETTQIAEIGVSNQTLIISCNYKF
jgi:long-subunit fatty acid transport protein